MLVIFEDDAIKLGSEDLEEFFNQVPADFNLIYMYLRLNPLSDFSEKLVKYNRSNPNIVRLNKNFAGWGTVSYIVSNKGPKTILQEVGIIKVPIDVELFNLLENDGLKVYASRVSLFAVDHKFQSYLGKMNRLKLNYQ